MFGLRPKLPVSDEQRMWIDEGFLRLEKLLGRSRMIEADVVLPNDDYFPDPYDRSSESVQKLFNRVCGFMGIKPETILLDIFPDVRDELREIVTVWHGGGSKACPAGLYYRPDDSTTERAEIALKQSLVKDPTKLIATISHELGHAILLGQRLIEDDIPDHEPLTDLLTVYLGLGIFTANSSAHFHQYNEAGRQGWSMSRLGYLNQEMYGYALARFATERREPRPEWASHLSTNVRVYLKRSSAWLASGSR